MFFIFVLGARWCLATIFDDFALCQRHCDCIVIYCRCVFSSQRCMFMSERVRGWDKPMGQSIRTSGAWLMNILWRVTCERFFFSVIRIPVMEMKELVGNVVIANSFCSELLPWMWRTCLLTVRGWKTYDHLPGAKHLLFRHAPFERRIIVNNPFIFHGKCEDCGACIFDTFDPPRRQFPRRFTCTRNYRLECYFH